MPPSQPRPKPNDPEIHDRRPTTQRPATQRPTTEDPRPEGGESPEVRGQEAGVREAGVREAGSQEAEVQEARIREAEDHAAGEGTRSSRRAWLQHQTGGPLSMYWIRHMTIQQSPGCRGGHSVSRAVTARRTYVYLCKYIIIFVYTACVVNVYM